MLNVPLVQADLRQGVLYCLEHLVALEDPVKNVKAVLMLKTLCVVNKRSAQKKTHLTYRRT